MSEKPNTVNTVEWFKLFGSNIGEAIGKKFKELEDRNKNLENRVDYLEKYLKIEPPPTPPQNLETKKENCLYFAGVVKGTFPKPSLEPEEYSLYRFEKIDESKARVYVIENNSNVARKFANNTDSHESTCEYLNQCPENPSSIETVECGEAVFDGNKWSIKTKVKIRYLG